MLQTILNHQNAAAWVGSLATLAAVVAALFQQEIRSLWDRPKLGLSVRLAPPDCHKTKLRGLNEKGEVIEVDSYYLRLWVTNLGSQMADKAQVFVAKLSKRHTDGTFLEEASFLPMNLRWAHSGAIYADIAPKMGKHCDLGHVDNPMGSASMADKFYGQPKTVLILDLEVQPNTGSHIIAPGIYRLELKIAANNVKPSTKIIELSLAGSWSVEETKMFAEGLGIKLLA